MSNHKPLVGVSACLMGENVRYDGGNKIHEIIARQLSEHLTLRPLCPEVAGGLGVPRPPANLVQHNDRIAAIGAKDPSLDVTRPFQRGAQKVVGQCPPQLCAYIVKARSPSCGAGSTPVYSTDGEIIEYGDGLLVRQLRQHFAQLWIVDEHYFDRPGAAKNFIEACRKLTLEQRISEP